MPDEQWYYAQAGQKQGPMPRAEVFSRISRGMIQRTDLVWVEGMAQWQPAGQVSGLFPASVPPPLPPIDSIPFAAPAPYAPPPDLGQNAGMRMLLPVGRSGWAIAAGYLGLFSVLLIFAPISVAVSIIAIRDIKKHPETHGMGRAVFGLVMGILGSIGLVVMAVALIAGRR
jgi:GYF domain 2